MHVATLVIYTIKMNWIHLLMTAVPLNFTYHLMQHTRPVLTAYTFPAPKISSHCGRSSIGSILWRFFVLYSDSILKTWKISTTYISNISDILEYGPMTNVMAALKNIDVPCAQRRKVWLAPTAQVPCSNATNIEHKTWRTQSEFCTWKISLRGKR